MILVSIAVTSEPIKAMTLGTHFTVGASLATALTDEKLPAFLLGFASHAVLDAIPHNDSRAEITVAMQIGAAIYLYKLIKEDNPKWKLALIGGLAGMLPDLEHSLKRNGIIPRSYYPSHTGSIRQPRAEPEIAFLFELGVSSVAFKVTF